MTPARVEHNSVATNMPLKDAPQHAPIHVAQRTPEALLAEVLQPVVSDMETMRLNLKNVVGQRHPMLMAAAEQIFSAGEWPSSWGGR